MNRSTILLLFISASSGNACGESLLPETNGHSLFNGTDLTGWPLILIGSAMVLVTLIAASLSNPKDGS